MRGYSPKNESTVIFIASNYFKFLLFYLRTPAVDTTEAFQFERRSAYQLRPPVAETKISSCETNTFWLRY